MRLRNRGNSRIIAVSGMHRSSEKVRIATFHACVYPTRSPQIELPNCSNGLYYGAMQSGDQPIK